jgi:hypothetical protein
MQSILESRILFFRRWRSDRAQIMFLDNEARLMDMIDRNYLSATLTRLLAPFPEPVVVAPTPQQITDAFQHVTPLPEGSCSICQDSFSETLGCVRLRNCRHTFHRTCATTWYSRSVFCPLCRNDIRVSPATPPNDIA